MWDTVAGVVVVFSWTWEFLCFAYFKIKLAKLFVKRIGHNFFSLIFSCLFLILGMPKSRQFLFQQIFQSPRILLSSSYSCKNLDDI